MNNKRFGAFSSSANPEVLSQTVNGIFVLVAGVVAFYAAKNGVSITAPEIQAQVATLTAAVGTIWTAVGVIRKVFVWGYDTFAPLFARMTRAY